jgi:uncharacterized protein
MALHVTALYAGLLGLIGIVLWAMVGPVRGRTNISLNDGGNTELIEASRRHMNWVENVPYIIVLFAIIELNGGSRTWLHAMGVVLVAARIVHPFGIDATNIRIWQRIAGAAGTFFVMIAATVTVLWQALGRML